MRNKRADLGEKFIITIIILIVSFLLILAVIKNMVSKADDITGELICRGSVAARANFYIGTTGEKQSMAPLLCKTKDKDVPLVSKGANKEAMEKDMADLVKRCWWQFGNGLVDNMFDDVLFGNEKCFVCYVAKMNMPGTTITRDEFSTYLSQTYVTPKQEDKKTSDMKDVTQYTYTTYVQSSGGNGKIVISMDKFEPMEQYSIAIVSPKFLTTWDTYKTEFLKAFVDPKADYNAYNYILIDKSTDLQNRCEIVPDVADT